MLAKFRKNISAVFTIHSLRDEYEKLSLINKIYTKLSIKYSDFNIVTNSGIKEKLLKWGAEQTKIRVVSPFLPPIEKEEDIQSLPEDARKFLDNHFPIISSNGSKIMFYNNIDLYGIDLLVELCYLLKSDYPDIGIIFSLPVVGDSAYYEKIKQRIREYKIASNFFFLNKKIPFYPILKKSHLFIRPTNTDGDSISLRESLYFSKPTISSDAVERPSGTILFKNRDINDLHAKVKKVMISVKRNNSDIAVRNEISGLEDILEIYSKGLKPGV
jgi:hypothetical protein